MKKNALIAKRGYLKLKVLLSVAGIFCVLFVCDSYFFSDGQVRLPTPPEHPKELLLLWNRDNQYKGNESEHFLSRTRVYTNLLAFGYITSGTPDERPDKCAPIVLINGEIYHYITGNNFFVSSFNLLHFFVFLRTIFHFCTALGFQPLSRDGLRFPRINGLFIH